MGGSRQDAARVAAVFVLVLILAFLGVGLEASGHTATAFLWALACLASGSTVGFRFGIPRIAQDGNPVRTPVPPPPAPAPKGLLAGQAKESPVHYHLLVNTNLERVSDWLTGIIVALGLVHLGAIPGYVDSLAQRLASGLGKREDELAFAVGLIVVFAVLGLFFGYLLTRLFLQGAFSRVDRSDLEDELKRMATRLEQRERAQRSSRAGGVFAVDRQEGG